MANPDKDAGDPQQVKVAQQKADLRDKRIAAGLALVMSHADSRLWLYSMLEAAGPFRDAFATNSSLMGYRCGEQAWSKALTAVLLEKHLEQYTRMMLENNQS